MINLSFALGYPVEFKHICLIYPPKVKEVVNDKNYVFYNRLLTLSQEDIEDEYIKNNKDLTDMLNPFEYILNNAYNDEQFRILLTQAFYFFTHEPVLFLFEEKQIIIGDLKNIKNTSELRILYESDYFEFQNLIREACGIIPLEAPDPNLNPRIKAMKAKARYRDKVKAKQGQSLTIQTIISSICCMNVGITPLNIGELSYAAVPMIIATYQEIEKYDLDIRSLLAGADSKKVKPKYWIRNLDQG